MDDRRAQFLIAVGDLCTAAGLAGLEVELRTGNGGETDARGVPHPRSAAEHGSEIDHTGYSAALTVDDRILNLDDVVACTVYSPDSGH